MQSRAKNDQPTRDEKSPGPQTATLVENQKAESQRDAVSRTTLSLGKYSSEKQMEWTLCNWILGDLEWILGCSVPHPHPKHSDLGNELACELSLGGRIS